MTKQELFEEAMEYFDFTEEEIKGKNFYSVSKDEIMSFFELETDDDFIDFVGDKSIKIIDDSEVYVSNKFTATIDQWNLFWMLEKRLFVED